MENKDFDQDVRKDKNCHFDYKPNRSGRVLAGLLVLIVGVALLGDRINIFDLPHWLFSWKVLIILLGLFVGFKDNFRNVAWLILIIVGGVFLMEDLYPEISLRAYFWPIIIIAIGLWMILSAGKKHSYSEKWKKKIYESKSYGCEDVIDSVTVFGGVKKTILSKDFKGGEIVTIFGGGEYNFTQSDFEGKIELEITQVFAGTTLIVPSNWLVKSQVDAVFGGLEDKRVLSSSEYEKEKVLVLKGITIFGGVSIKSY